MEISLEHCVDFMVRYIQHNFQAVRMKVMTTKGIYRHILTEIGVYVCQRIFLAKVCVKLDGSIEKKFE